MARIAVFIDGGYFDEVSKYYKFQHARGSRLNVRGVLEFIRQQVAEAEKIDQCYSQVVESHYFRGRFSTDSAVQAGKLEDERRFDEVLMRAGIASHYLPIDENNSREKGIDVWLSLEAFDLAIHKNFDVIVLIACDGDYVPLIHKLNGIGTRSMVLAWDFSYEFEWQGQRRRKETRTSSELIRVSTYPVMMNAIIEDRSRRNDPVIKGMFVWS